MLRLPSEISPRQWRRLQPVLQQLFAILDEPSDVSPGDQEVAAVLLPAWHAAFGSSAVTVADLFGATAGPGLGGFLAAWRERYAGDDQKARQHLGLLLKRLDGCDVAGFTVRSLPVESGVRGWTLAG